MNKKSPALKAFTLIELLVVISIISLLSSIVLASLSSAASRARDMVRIQDFKTIKQAVERYHINNNRYPGGGDTNNQISRNCPTTELYKDLVSSGDYLPEMPTDPKENIVSCSNLHFDYVDEFFYGFDHQNSGGDYCMGINNFETEKALEQLSTINEQPNANFGGGGNLDQAEFVFCFDGFTQ